jgi:hypothetical protein
MMTCCRFVQDKLEREGVCHDIRNHLSVSNSSSGSDWELDEVPNSRRPTGPGCLVDRELVRSHPGADISATPTARPRCETEIDGWDSRMTVSDPTVEAKSLSMHEHDQ